MKLKCIACDSMARLVYFSAALSPHIIDISMFMLGLHNQPADLRSRLQSEVDQVEDGYDAIVLAYALCGKATEGLMARSIPLVIPKAHDCITLFLGSRKQYEEQHDQFPGTYWYALDYIERGLAYGSSLTLGATTTGIGNDIQEVYEAYEKKYGKDNADYLMEVMGAWQSRYQRAVYIDMGIGDGENVATRAQADAARRNWRYERLTGDRKLIKQLLFGEWDYNFLIINPGQKIIMTFDENVIGAQNI